MKNPLILLLAVPLLTGTGDESAEDAVKHAPKAFQSIAAQDLETHASKLASDEFGGRLTGTEGQIATAKYIADRFKRFGLEPMGERKGGSHDWFHRYKVLLKRLDPKSTGLFVGTKRINKGGAFFFRARNASMRLRGNFVFVGTAADDVLAGVKLKFRIPVAILREAKFGGGNVFAAGQYSAVEMAKIRGIAKRVDSRGGKAVVILAKAWNPALLSMANTLALYPGKPLVTEGWKDSRRQFRQPPPAIPVLLLGGDDSKAVISRLKLDAEQAFDANNELAVGRKSSSRAKLAYRMTTDKTEALNVVGCLPGSSPKFRSQAVIYSCHMDHLGRAADGEAFYGADDNASGCSTVLEIAEAYGKLAHDERPKRSTLFVVVSGEELGLWGSKHFCESPTWPLSNVVADINMDMLGRSTERVPSSTISVTPSYRHPKYSTLVRDAHDLAKVIGLKFGNADKFYARSDHYNFAKQGIPVLFFSDDEHPDYHMTTDTADKLDYDKMQRVARLAFLVGYRASNRPGKPRVLGNQNSW